MRKELLWIASIAVVLATSPAQAVDVEKAREVLLGAWVNTLGGETWEFDADNQWTQYVGGKTIVSGFSLEERPLNMFAINLLKTDTTYVVHVMANGYLQIYREGQEASVGTYRPFPPR